MGSVEKLKKSAIAGRAGRVSGSLVAGLLKDDSGDPISPWMDECDVYSRIINGWSVPDNAAMRRGRIFEPWVRAVASRRLGFDIREPWRETVFSACGRFSGSFDGIAYDETGAKLGVVELKTASKRSRAWYGETPRHYALQLEHYKWMAKLDQGWVVCLEADDEVFSDIMSEIELVYRMAYEEIQESSDEFWDIKTGDGVHIYEDDCVVDIAVDVIERRLRNRTINLHVREHHESIDTYESDIVPILSDWFDNHIATKTPPELTGSNGAVEIVRSMFPKNEGEAEISMDDDSARDFVDIADLIAKRSKLGDEIKTLEKQAKQLDVEILRQLGSRRSSTLSRPPEGKERKAKRVAKASIVTTKRKGEIDVDKLIAEHAEKVESFSAFDVKAFAEAHPEIVERYRSEPKVSKRVSVTVYKGGDVALSRFVEGALEEKLHKVEND